MSESSRADVPVRLAVDRPDLLRTVVVGLVYAVLACIVFWPIAPLDPTHLVGACACGDAVQQTWFLQWAAFALQHGLNPLFSSYLNAPVGVNLGVNTSMPLLGILGAPVTVTAGPIAAFNLLLRVSLAMSALSMYLVLKRYVRSMAAAFVGGLLFGFSPYMLGEGRLHVFLVFLPLLPPLIPLIDRWLIRADKNPYVCGGLVGLLLGLEMLISAELAIVFVVFVAVALVPIAITHRRLVRSRVPALLRGLAACAVAGVLVGGSVAWMFLAGPERPQGPPHSVWNLDSYHADLLSLIVPSRPQLIRPPLLLATADRFVRGNLHENGFYLGLPMVVLLTAGSMRLRRCTIVRSFATLGVVGFLLGLGTQLTVADHVTGIPLPMAAITGIPALQEIGPTRFALAIQLAASVLLALVLDHLALRAPAAHSWRSRVVLALLPAVALVPLLPDGLIPSTEVSIPSYFAGSAVQEIPAGTTVLPFPFPYYSNNTAMLWQASSGMRFRMPGGEIYVPGDTGRSVNYPHGGLPSALWAVLVEGGPHRTTHWRPPSNAQRPHLLSALRTYVGSGRIGALVISSGGEQGRWVSALAESAFGAPTSVRGVMDVGISPVP
ncbi:MAG: hypothetical protein ACTHJL_12300 [Amnibacterium sp.]